jgi:hypothetical protein
MYVYIRRYIKFNIIIIIIMYVMGDKPKLNGVSISLILMSDYFMHPQVAQALNMRAA